MRIKNYNYLVLPIIFLVCARPGYSFSRIELSLKEINKREPVFSEIVREGFRQEQLELSRMSSWKKKMKAAPWFPDLYIGYDHSFRNTSGLSINDNVSVTSSGVVIGPQDSDQDQTLVKGDSINVRAVWKLDELIFHPAALSVSREGREIFKNRLQFRDYLFKIYSERKKLMAEYYFVRRQTRYKSLIISDRINSLTQQLDSMTNHVFSDRWWENE